VGHKTGAMRTSENSFKANFRESPECELRRILIPRTSVNKGKKDKRKREPILDMGSPNSLLSLPDSTPLGSRGF
jgi:hypothetical protein